MSHFISALTKTIRVFAVCIVMLTAFLPSPTRAQCSNTTQGKDFWFMFMDNYDNSVTLSLIVTAAKTILDDGTWVNVQVYISNPTKKWGKMLQVPLGGSEVIEIPKSYAVSSTVNSKTYFGFHVEANVEVSLYASNFNDATFDIATIYPTSTLDTEYVVQTYDGLTGGLGTEVGFVATEDYTDLKMVLPCATTSGGYKKNDTLKISLDEGETFLLKAADGGNLSGMRVVSNGHPFAVFQGTGCANVPSTCYACDHLYEQTLPLKMWDQKYVIAPTAKHTNGDRAIVTANFDGTEVTLDGETLCTLDAGKSKEFEVSSSTSHLLESTLPVTVCLYVKGASCADGVGDPAAVIIPPVSQGLNRVRFQAIGTERTKYHYVNIIVPTEAKDSMMLNDTLVNGTYIDLDCGYSTIQLAVDTGTHTLSNTAGKFIAYFYGLGDYESYAYIAGMSLRNLHNHIYVEEIDKTDNPFPYTACFGNPVRLRVDMNDRNDPGAWHVDGEYLYLIDTVVNWDFDTPGLHRVDVVSSSGCDTVTAYVFCRDPHDSIAAEICFGDTYTVDTFSFKTSGLHTFALTDSYGCDSIITLDLTIIDSSYSVLVDTACEGRPYSWRGVQRDTTGLYVDTLTSSHGCDSVVALDLTVLKIPATPFTYVSHCEDGSYTVNVDLSNAAVNGELPDLRWFSEPPDSSLVGQEHETSVRVLPLTYTVYGIEVDYLCNFIKSIGLNVVEVPHAALKVSPEALDYDRPEFDAYDISTNADRRQWWVDNLLMSEQSSALHYAVDVQNSDSVVVMLVASDGTCSDTAWHTLPVWHTGVYAANIFMPNDYSNPRFTVMVHDVELESLTIYNRHGSLVYHNEENPEEGWDGTHDGKPCPQGTYVWTAAYRRADSPTRPHVVTGTVTLIR